MTGIGVGAAGSGMRPVIGWGNVTFSMVAFDQIVNQAAKIRYMFGGQATFPIVFHASYNNGLRSAAQHSQTGFAMYAHAGGLKLVTPTTPENAYGLMRAAIRDDNPVVFLWGERVAGREAEVPAEGWPAAALGEASILRTGSDVTLVAVGATVPIAEQAAEQLARAGVSVELIDPVSLVPLDIATIRESVIRTQRLVVLDESFPTCSIAAEIQALVAEDPACFRALRAPVTRVCAAAVPVPFSAVLEDFVLPDAEDVRRAIEWVMRP